MKLDVAQIEGFAIKLLDGTAKVYPPAAPLIALIEGIVEVADEYGIIPHELPAAQVMEMAAHGAADRASLLTEYRAHHPTPVGVDPFAGRVCRACKAPILASNVAIADQCPCNSGRGINHGIVAPEVCTCAVCDPDQTGSSRVILKSSPIVAKGLGQQ